MLLPLPKRFDANEWFILLNIIFGFSWVLFMPKRYPNAISTLVILFSVTIALILDHTLATPPLDLYDINDYKKYELMDVITYFMYTPYALLFVYLYDKWDPKGYYFTAYIVAWSLLSTFFEWLAVLCHVFTYNNWNLLYSFAVYLASSAIDIWFFKFILRYLKKQSESAVAT